VLQVREVILEQKGFRVPLVKEVNAALLEKGVSKGALAILDYKGLKVLLVQLVLLEGKVILAYRVLKDLKDSGV